MYVFTLQADTAQADSLNDQHGSCNNYNTFNMGQ